MRMGRMLASGVGSCLVVLSLGCGSGVPGGEYLPRELRARVEQLKQDVAASPSTPETVKDRARVLWDWANAYARRGGDLPVELPLVVATTLSWGEETPVGLDNLAKVDQYVHELGVREECPECIGTLTNDAGEPFPAGSYQTMVQTYTVGSMGMKPGGAIMLAKHFMSDHGVFQRDDAAADNYVAITCSRQGATFANDTVTMGGMHGGFLGGGLATMIYRLEGPALEQGDTVTVTYGDTSGGSKGLKVQTYANDFMPLPVYVDLEAQGDFFTLPIVPYRIRGVEAYGVHGFAPSIVGVGEPFEISVRTEDLYYNRATGDIPSYEVLVNGQHRSTIPAGSDGITVLSDLRFNSEGVYRFSFRSADGKIVGVANPVWVRSDPEQRIYWGEMHAHGGFAEGLGLPEWFFRFAKEDAYLDFVSLSEHDLWMDDHEWEVMRDYVNRYDEDGKFIAFLGYEWTVQSVRGGHHNVFFRDTANRQRVPCQTAPTLTDLYAGLRADNRLEDVLIIPHCHEPGDWRMNDPDLEKLIEVMSMHGNFEWFGQRYVNQGYQMGFIAGSDDHLSHPGYTGALARGLFQHGGLAAVLAPSKTRDAIFDGLRDIAAYATTGQRIIVDVDLNGARMGTRTAMAADRHLEGRVIGTSPIDTVTVVKNGKDVWTKDYLTTARPAVGWVAVDFASQAEEFFREAPRGWRIWTGSLEVKGARLVSFDTPQFFNRYTEFARVDPANPNRILFTTGTRGRASSILMKLEGISPGATVVIDLAATTEIPSTPQAYRKPAQIPPAHVVLPFGAVSGGRYQQQFKVDRYTDSVSLRYLDPNGADDLQFEVTDNDPVTQGDYYYVRVKQLDGAMAWSSPIWVGGVPPT